MKSRTYILSIALLLSFLPALIYAQAERQTISFDFYGDIINFTVTDAANVPFNDTLSGKTINSFYERIAVTDYKPVVDAILAYKRCYDPDDWVYYQLVCRAAQSMCSKTDSYNRYTLYKWFLLCKSGYDATLNVIGDKLLFYVHSDDDIYDVPCFSSSGKKYVCVNYDDYGFNIDFEHGKLYNVHIPIRGAESRFSYKLTRLPHFRAEHYSEKDISFIYHDVDYHFKIKLSEDVKKIFTNYPVADYQLYFNEPLSSETYNSLIPQLRKNIKRMSVKDGVDYLMHFTRYAFAYETDQENFGREKHLSPEQTLLYDHSDCEDRAALFYCLVKEIYNLPMIVMAYPHHLTIAVKFDKPFGQPICYNGSIYSVCEPTPQTEDIPLGGLPPELKATAYEVAYVYDPVGK